MRGLSDSWPRTRRTAKLGGAKSFLPTRTRPSRVQSEGPRRGDDHARHYTFNYSIIWPGIVRSRPEPAQGRLRSPGFADTGRAPQVVGSLHAEQCAHRRPPARHGAWRPGSGPDASRRRQSDSNPGAARLRHGDGQRPPRHRRPRQQPHLPDFGLKGLATSRHAKPKTRDCSETERMLVWGAFESVGGPFGPIGKLLHLTGARSREIAERRDRGIRAGCIPNPFPARLRSNIFSLALKKQLSLPHHRD